MKSARAIYNWVEASDDLTLANLHQACGLHVEQVRHVWSITATMSSGDVWILQQFDSKEDCLAAFEALKHGVVT